MRTFFRNSLDKFFGKGFILFGGFCDVLLGEVRRKQHANRADDEDCYYFYCFQKYAYIFS